MAITMSSLPLGIREFLQGKLMRGEINQAGLDNLLAGRADLGGWLQSVGGPSLSGQAPAPPPSAAPPPPPPPPPAPSSPVQTPAPVQAPAPVAHTPPPAPPPAQDIAPVDRMDPHERFSAFLNTMRGLQGQVDPSVIQSASTLLSQSPDFLNQNFSQFQADPKKFVEAAAAFQQSGNISDFLSVLRGSPVPQGGQPGQPDQPASQPLQSSGSSIIDSLRQQLLDLGYTGEIGTLDRDQLTSLIAGLQNPQTGGSKISATPFVDPVGPPPPPPPPTGGGSGVKPGTEGGNGPLDPVGPPGPPPPPRPDPVQTTAMRSVDDANQLAATTKTAADVNPFVDALKSLQDQIAGLQVPSIQSGIDLLGQRQETGLQDLLSGFRSTLDQVNKPLLDLLTEQRAATETFRNDFEARQQARQQEQELFNQQEAARRAGLDRLLEDLVKSRSRLFDEGGNLIHDDITRANLSALERQKGEAREQLATTLQGLGVLRGSTDPRGAFSDLEGEFGQLRMNEIGRGQERSERAFNDALALLQERRTNRELDERLLQQERALGIQEGTLGLQALGEFGTSVRSGQDVALRGTLGLGELLGTLGGFQTLGGRAADRADDAENRATYQLFGVGPGGRPTLETMQSIGSVGGLPTVDQQQVSIQQQLADLREIIDTGRLGLDASQGNRRLDIEQQLANLRGDELQMNAISGATNTLFQGLDHLGLFDHTRGILGRGFTEGQIQALKAAGLTDEQIAEMNPGGNLPPLAKDIGTSLAYLGAGEAGNQLLNFIPGRTGDVLGAGARGAGIGAALGNVIPIPGVGAGIGAMVGGGIGMLGSALFGGESEQERLKNNISEMELADVQAALRSLSGRTDQESMVMRLWLTQQLAYLLNADPRQMLSYAPEV